MAYKNKKKNKAHVRALHRPIKAKRKRDEKRRRFISKPSPTFIPRHRDY